ncbi:hypothetical protein EDEG_01660 [Edhazardia aedis USNM 41457]|uniref:SWIM-type domain-containing protein n=1 Tax=Edhazardia aedis (strain USNM 41457) TaxID=1003232 RepID=J9D8C3_EDHAE|nr:hypothetical protein EDEG_01660 [Edhazardia aedis USNM 41457]|eukprot:EJW04026.1 hypothetical protein EDEG_01660 [Edhazardia aedis USNM 41457]
MNDGLPGTISLTEILINPKAPFPNTEEISKIPHNKEYVNIDFDLEENPTIQYAKELQSINTCDIDVSYNHDYIFIQFNQLKHLVRNVMEIKVVERNEGFVIYGIVFDPNDYPIIYNFMVCNIHDNKEKRDTKVESKRVQKNVEIDVAKDVQVKNVQKSREVSKTVDCDGLKILGRKLVRRTRKEKVENEPEGVVKKKRVYRRKVNIDSGVSSRARNVKENFKKRKRKTVSGLNESSSDENSDFVSIGLKYSRQDENVDNKARNSMYKSVGNADKNLDFCEDRNEKINFNPRSAENVSSQINGDELTSLSSQVSVKKRRNRSIAKNNNKTNTLYSETNSLLQSENTESCVKTTKKSKKARNTRINNQKLQNIYASLTGKNVSVNMDVEDLVYAKERTDPNFLIHPVTYEIKLQQKNYSFDKSFLVAEEYQKKIIKENSCVKCVNVSEIISCDDKNDISKCCYLRNSVSSVKNSEYAKINDLLFSDHENEFSLEKNIKNNEKENINGNSLDYNTINSISLNNIQENILRESDDKSDLQKDNQKHKKSFETTQSTESNKKIENLYKELFNDIYISKKEKNQGCITAVYDSTSPLNTLTFTLINNIQNSMHLVFSPKMSSLYDCIKQFLLLVDLKHFYIITEFNKPAIEVFDALLSEIKFNYVIKTRDLIKEFYKVDKSRVDIFYGICNSYVKPFQKCNNMETSIAACENKNSDNSENIKETDKNMNSTEKQTNYILTDNFILLHDDPSKNYTNTLAPSHHIINSNQDTLGPMSHNSIGSEINYLGLQKQLVSETKKSDVILNQNTTLSTIFNDNNQNIDKNSFNKQIGKKETDNIDNTSFETNNNEKCNKEKTNNEENEHNKVDLPCNYIEEEKYNDIMNIIMAIYPFKTRSLISKYNLFDLQNIHESELEYINNTVYSMDLVECFDTILGSLKTSVKIVNEEAGLNNLNMHEENLASLQHLNQEKNYNVVSTDIEDKVNTNSVQKTVNITNACIIENLKDISYMNSLSKSIDSNVQDNIRNSLSSDNTNNLQNISKIGEKKLYTCDASSFGYKVRRIINKNLEKRSCMRVVKIHNTSNTVFETQLSNFNDKKLLNTYQKNGLIANSSDKKDNIILLSSNQQNNLISNSPNQQTYMQNSNNNIQITDIKNMYVPSQNKCNNIEKDNLNICSMDSRKQNYPDPLNFNFQINDNVNLHANLTNKNSANHQINNLMINQSYNNIYNGSSNNNDTFNNTKPENHIYTPSSNSNNSMMQSKLQYCTQKKNMNNANNLYHISTIRDQPQLDIHKNTHIDTFYKDNQLNTPNNKTSQITGPLDMANSRFLNSIREKNFNNLSKSFDVSLTPKNYQYSPLNQTNSSELIENYNLYRKTYLNNSSSINHIRDYDSDDKLQHNNVCNFQRNHKENSIQLMLHKSNINNQKKIENLAAYVNQQNHPQHKNLLNSTASLSSQILKNDSQNDFDRKMRLNSFINNVKKQNFGNLYANRNSQYPQKEVLSKIGNTNTNNYQNYSNINNANYNDISKLGFNNNPNNLKNSHIPHSSYNNAMNTNHNIINHNNTSFNSQNPLLNSQFMVNRNSQTSESYATKNDYTNSLYQKMNTTVSSNKYPLISRKYPTLVPYNTENQASPHSNDLNNNFLHSSQQERTNFTDNCIENLTNNLSPSVFCKNSINQHNLGTYSDIQNNPTKTVFQNKSILYNNFQLPSSIKYNDNIYEKDKSTLFSTGSNTTYNNNKNQSNMNSKNDQENSKFYQQETHNYTKNNINHSNLLRNIECNKSSKLLESYDNQFFDQYYIDSKNTNIPNISIAELNSNTKNNLFSPQKNILSINDNLKNCASQLSVSQNSPKQNQNDETLISSNTEKNSNEENLYIVTDITINKEYIVDLHNCTCTCGRFQMLMIPCMHACAVVENPYKYISIIYNNMAFDFKYNVKCVLSYNKNLKEKKFEKSTENRKTKSVQKGQRNQCASTFCNSSKNENVQNSQNKNLNLGTDTTKS